jgi:NADP-dependent aldehyde dehydrogenase
VARELAAAAAESGLPGATFALLQASGIEVGEALVDEPAIAAVGFTGSFAGGKALHDRAAARERPIPVFAEMGSVNPIVVTEAALTERGAAIAEGLATSVASFGGQLCTKPGVVFVPAGEAGEAFAADLGARLAGSDPQVLLNERLRDALTDRVAELGGLAAAVDGAAEAAEPGFRFRPAAYRAAATAVREHPELLEERFGPVVLLLTYESRDELLDALVRVDGQLTGTIHAQASDADLVALLAAALSERSGRLIFDGFPTGVAVTHGMHHGGPFPATTAPAHTSVGMTAIRRFLRPVAFQNAPAHVLPPELQDANPLGIWRRVDGELTRDALGQ